MRLATQILLFLPIAVSYWYAHTKLAVWVQWLPDLFSDRPWRLAGLLAAKLGSESTFSHVQAKNSALTPVRLPTIGSTRMTKDVRFELPVDYRDEEIISFFMWPPEDLNDALDLDVGQAGDSRLTIDDIRVEQVDLAADKISIQYEIEFSAYYGCDDANFSDCDSREVVGRREGNTFVFDHVSLPEPRNTYDEY